MNIKVFIMVIIIQLYNKRYYLDLFDSSMHPAHLYRVEPLEALNNFRPATNLGFWQ